MLDAVPYSSASILTILETWSLGGITSEIILVPALSLYDDDGDYYDRNDNETDDNNGVDNNGDDVY